MPAAEKPLLPFPCGLSDAEKLLTREGLSCGTQNEALRRLLGFDAVKLQPLPSTALRPSVFTVKLSVLDGSL